jgi:hypothetical protein
MKANIFIDIPYNHLVKVPLALAEQLSDCLLCKQEYVNGRYVYKESKESIGFSMVKQEDIMLLEDTKTIEIEEILEENNRLTRGNERLLRELSKAKESSSTQLEVL